MVNPHDELEVIEVGNVRIVGIAQNAKMGAVIVTKKDEVYYIEGLEQWDEKYYSKKLRITGFCVIEKRTFEKQYFPDGEEIQIAYPPEVKKLIQKHAIKKVAIRKKCLTPPNSP